MAAERVLVDTSIWIEYLRKPAYPFGATLRHWLETGRACSSELILGELLQGAKDPRDETAVEILYSSTAPLRPKEGTWRQAGRLSARLRKKGVTIHLLDCLLAVLAVENGASLASRDHHFEVISKNYPLELVSEPR